MIQEEIALPKMLNLAINSVVHHWISLTEEDESATYEGLGIVLGRYMGVFYEDYGMIESRDPEQLQGAINIFI